MNINDSNDIRRTPVDQGVMHDNSFNAAGIDKEGTGNIFSSGPPVKLEKQHPADSPWKPTHPTEDLSARQPFRDCKFSEDQVIAWHAIMAFYADPRQGEYILEGAGGCGKSFLIGKLAEAFKGGGVYLTATTHKATKVVQQMAIDVGVEASTIHHLCSLRLVNNLDTGEKVLISASELCLEDGEDKSFVKLWGASPLIIVDECSMLDRGLLGMVRDFAYKEHAKILFVGDRYQLPPIKESGYSEVFSTVAGISQLYTPHRQDESNPILPLGDAFRQAMVTSGCLMPEIETHPSGKIERIDNREAFDQSFIDAVVSGKDCVFLAWTNDRVQSMNYRARAADAGFSPTTPPQRGEWMRANTTIHRSTPNGRGGWDNVPVLRNDMAVEVLSATPAFHFDTDGYWMAVRVLGGDDEVPAGCVVRDLFMPSNFRDVKKRVSEKTTIGIAANKLRDAEEQTNGNFTALYLELVQAAKRAWREKFEVEEALCDLRYKYASTIHKSQGSGWDEVWFDQEDVSGCNAHLPRMQLTYVAISRPREVLHVHGRMKAPPWCTASHGGVQ